MTSRGRLMDAVNLIAEQIAYASHCQELINVAQTEQDKDTINKQSDLLEQSIAIRRRVMGTIKTTYENHNPKLWCSLKHAIGAYQFATECLYADKDSDENRRLIQQECYELMVSTLAYFCGIDELITCSRCLEDMLDNQKLAEK